MQAPELTTKEKSRTYPLRQLYFYLTAGCNLYCRHCWIAPRFQTPGNPGVSLEVGLFSQVIDQAKPLGLSTVKLTGGEPLLHPQIDQLLEIIRKENLRLVVETNGVLCTPALAGAIAACPNPYVSVSLDGFNPETHDWVRGVKGAFDSALAGIRNLVTAGLQPQIIMSLMKRNQDQMQSVVRLAESLGAGSVKFNLIQPTARGEKLFKEGETLSIEELVRLGEWVEKTLSKATPLELVYSHPPAFRSLGKMFDQNGGDCRVCNILNVLGVLSDGSYALCGIGETVPALIFGHGAKDRLTTVWDETDILKDLRQGLPGRLQGICANCLMKRFCLGNCIALNYFLTKNLWAPFWYCDQAWKSGLFQTTRLGE